MRCITMNKEKQFARISHDRSCTLPRVSCLTPGCGEAEHLIRASAVKQNVTRDHQTRHNASHDLYKHGLMLNHHIYVDFVDCREGKELGDTIRSALALASSFRNNSVNYVRIILIH